jgi:hypothetical protein
LITNHWGWNSTTGDDIQLLGMMIGPHSLLNHLWQMDFLRKKTTSFQLSIPDGTNYPVWTITIHILDMVIIHFDKLQFFLTEKLSFSVLFQRIRVFWVSGTLGPRKQYPSWKNRKHSKEIPTSNDWKSNHKPLSILMCVYIALLAGEIWNFIIILF